MASSDNPSWKEKLAGDMPPLWAEQIDEFETQIILRKAGKIDEKVFAETRLRRGAYGQRYDNGLRYDGLTTQTLGYNVYSDSTRTSVWGDGAGAPQLSSSMKLINPRDTITNNHTAYGRVPAVQDVGAGIYVDALLLTLNW